MIAAPAAGGIARALLREVAQLLKKLAEEGEGGSIDLRSLPMSDADRDEVRERLGRGEVRADLDVAGTSEVWETRYAGVWWIRHFGSGDRIAAEEIAVTGVPAILVAHRADIVAAASRIENDLETPPASGREEGIRNA
ncbi:MAG TPA: hydrogenase expression/formation C-terminal domain-containing protein [Usitatibacter sp.]|nr:hydrogenase expression/formation C-terminal domain-containing protein [Usitatibacter sp.]